MLETIKINKNNIDDIIKCSNAYGGHQQTNKLILKCVVSDATPAIPVDFISKNNKNCHKKLDEKKCM